MSPAVSKTGLCSILSWLPASFLMYTAHFVVRCEILSAMDVWNWLCQY